MVKSMWREDRGMKLYRESIGNMYIFIHFITPVVLYIAGKAIAVQSGGCIFFEANSEQHFASPDCELIHDWFHADISCGSLMQKYDIKPNVVGHWGTAPGQNFIYAHLNRLITKYKAEMIYISGPGHGGQAMISNNYLEGTYSMFYPEITEEEEGKKKKSKRF